MWKTNTLYVQHDLMYNTCDLQIIQFYEITCQDGLLTCRLTTIPLVKIWYCQWHIGGVILTGETEVVGEKLYAAWVVDEWMSMEQWWDDTDRVNWSTGRKTLCSVGGRWMNECGAVVEWYWQGKLKYWEKNFVLGEKLYAAWVVEVVEWYWQGKLKYWEKNFIQRGW